ncbi:MAG: cytochrome C [Sulfurimonas sp.]|uniref:cytochrome C n=1 Tax=Sulfurimonas sp. TaxID=2022749 RepID=UPI0025FD59BA|nr:cytochrome C [Sulfurimonas sp.]MCK9490629.1 cytochrome C [Sulfurimonas sp.]
MNKLIKSILASAMILAVGTTVASADVAKGQKLYLKKLKSSCDMTGAKMASQHSQFEWETFKSEGKLADELKKICPKTPSKALKDKYLEHYYDFFYEYANDSGNVPSC